MATKYRKWFLVGFAVYVLLMLWLLFGQRWGQWTGGLNLEPLDTVRSYFWVLRYSRDAELIRHAVVNLAGNVLMFVPLGFFVPALWQKMDKIYWHIPAMLGTIVAIELLQLITRLGSCDVDDLILNLVGTTLGFALWKIIRCGR